MTITFSGTNVTPGVQPQGEDVAIRCSSSWWIAAAALLVASAAAAQDCPELVGRWPYGSMDALAVAVSTVYAGSGSVLLLLDLSDPSTPVLAGSITLAGPVHGIAVAGILAYVGAWSEGQRVVDVSTPSAPVEVGFYDTAGHAQGVTVAGGYVYVADYDNGMVVLTDCNPLFADGFESGDTSAWGVTVP